MTEATMSAAQVAEVVARAYASRERVEIVWVAGHEDYRGYGARPGVDGKRARGYIGRSTGTVKIWLLVDNARSLGGGALSLDAVASIRSLGYGRGGSRHKTGLTLAGGKYAR